MFLTTPHNCILWCCDKTVAATPVRPRAMDILRRSRNGLPAESQNNRRCCGAGNDVPVVKNHRAVAISEAIPPAVMGSTNAPRSRGKDLRRSHDSNAGILKVLIWLFPSLMVLLVIPTQTEICLRRAGIAEKNKLV